MTKAAKIVAPSKSFLKTTPPDAIKATALFIMLVAILYFGREVLIPLTLALLLAFILSPLVDLMTRLRIGRIPSVLLAVTLALAVVAATGSVIGEQLSEFTADAPEYVSTLQTKFSALKNETFDRVSSVTDKMVPHGNSGPPSKAGGKPGKQTPTAAQPAGPEDSPALALSPLTLTERYLTTVLSPLATAAIVFVIAVFALLQREDLRNRLIRLVGSDDLHQTTVAIDDGGRRLSRYFLTQLIINGVYALVIGLGLFIIGVPNPALWAILSGLLRFVPYVGPVISALLPMILAAAVRPGWTMVLWTGGLYLVVELLTGQIIEPVIYGNSTGLSPFSVIVAALFWSWVWGPIGLILSTPLTLCLVVIGRHAKRLEFLDVLLGDREALTPIETFYQRVLAGDPDEAQEHAERLLKEVSLSTYYDEVAIKALRRAAADSSRGAIDREQLQSIRTAIDSLVTGLGAQPDDRPQTNETGPLVSLGIEEQQIAQNPDPESISQETDVLTEEWRNRPAVLCISGRGPLDEAATAMLVQLLGKHGMNARQVNFQDVSREQITRLEFNEIAMVCVCYLDLRSIPASLRYLMQRLRQRLPPKTPILIGLWPRDGAVLENDEDSQAIGADFYTNSLEESVSTCAETALKEGQLAQEHDSALPQADQIPGTERMVSPT